MFLHVVAFHLFAVPPHPRVVATRSTSLVVLPVSTVAGSLGAVSHGVNPRASSEHNGTHSPSAKKGNSEAAAGQSRVGRMLGDIAGLSRLSASSLVCGKVANYVFAIGLVQASVFSSL